MSRATNQYGVWLMGDEKTSDLKERIRQEREEYEKKKREFYSNPIHWSNNRRKMHGLSLLRGKINRGRIKEYPKFHSSAVFYIIEEVIEDVLGDRLSRDEFFDEFVEFNDLNMGGSIDINCEQEYQLQHIFTSDYRSCSGLLKSHQMVERFIYDKQ